MLSQLTFLDPPIARQSDPAPSHVAARDVQLGLLQQRLVAVVESLGAPTAAEAAKECARLWGGLAESYRKRAGECVRRGALRAGAARACAVSGKLATTYRVK